MTLGDLINVVTTKCGLLEAEDLQAARSFAKQRHQVIFNDCLWKDALREWDYSIALNGLALTTNLQDDGSHITPESLAAFKATSPSATEFFKSLNDCYGRIMPPAGSDRIVAVRSCDRHLNVQSREVFYRFDQDNFFRTGTPCDFIELQSCVFSTPFAQSARLVFAIDNIADNLQKVTVKWLQGNGRVYTDTFTLSYDTPVAIFRDVGNGEAIYSATCSENTALLDCFSIIKTTFAGNLIFGIGDGSTTPRTLASTSSIFNIPSVETSAPIVPRIQLVTPPNKDMTLRFLVKMKCPQFQNDSDETAIRNMDNCLIAFVTADCLEFDKNYSAAQLKFQEAAVLLQQLKDVEALQSANYQQFIPENGYAIPFKTGSYWGTF